MFSRCSSFYSTRLLSQSSAEVRDCAKTRYSKRGAYSVNNRAKWLPGHRKTGTFGVLCLVIFVPSKSVSEFQCSEDLIVGKLLFCVLDCNSVGLSRPQRSQLIVFSFVLRNIRIFCPVVQAHSFIIRTFLPFDMSAIWKWTIWRRLHPRTKLKHILVYLLARS